MPTYTLELELYSVLNASTSDFEIWTDGSQLGGGYTITSSGTILIDPAVFYAGSLPTSLEFRFDDAVGATVDQIDISDLLTGFTADSNISEFLQLTDSGSDTLIQVDANGATGGFNYVTIGEIEGITGMDEVALYANGNIIA